MSEATTRVTKTLSLPSGKTAEVYTYMTARERNEVKKGIYESMTLKQVEGSKQQGELTGGSLATAEQKVLNLMLVKYGELTGQSAVNALLDQDPADYDAIMIELDAVTKQTFQTAK